MTYRIKPLVWTKYGPLTWELKTIFGKYSVFTRDGKWFVWFAGQDNYKGCASLAHGQKLAWEDWQARILPALEEVPEPINQRLLDALKATGDMFQGTLDICQQAIMRQTESADRIVTAAKVIGRFDANDQVIAEAEAERGRE